MLSRRCFWLLRIFDPKGVVQLAQGETLGTATEGIVFKSLGGSSQGFTLG